MVAAAQAGGVRHINGASLLSQTHVKDPLMAPKSLACSSKLHGTEVLCPLVICKYM